VTQNVAVIAAGIDVTATDELANAAETNVSVNQFWVAQRFSAAIKLLN
jgi:hypothetical protein